MSKKNPVDEIISRTIIELIIIAFILVISFLVFSKYDALEKIVSFSSKYESYEIDEIISTSIVLLIYLVFFSFMKLRKVIKITTILHERNKELKASLNDIKILKGVIPICMHCKGIRDDKGAWNILEKYISEHSNAQFSHGICEKCLKKHYPEEAS